MSEQERKMEKLGIWSVLSWRHFLVLSLALNIGLIFRAVYEGESWREKREKPELREAHMADEIDRNAAHISKSPLRFGSAACTDGQDEGELTINLDHGDPTMYKEYWQRMGDKTTVVISGWEGISYFSDIRNLCWFLEPEFAKQVVRIHKTVGNAITENRHIVVGTGSTQLYQAALYALSPQDASEPTNVFSAAPFYSSYPLMTDFLKSRLFKWAGDVGNLEMEGPHIELVTSPNNPDGFTRQPSSRRSRGVLIHDFAYYWPQYTPITHAADHDLMLFTVSKSTGHAGMRIGWAIVKDPEVAKRMTKYIELNTIGVSKDSQLRAAKVLKAVSDSCQHLRGDTFFDYGHGKMAERWQKLRAAVEQSGIFSLPEFPPAYCSFHRRNFATQPAFAWLKCKEEIEEDCEVLLRRRKILTRGGVHFGSSPNYVRISMLPPDEIYDQFVKRLSRISL